MALTRLRAGTALIGTIADARIAASSVNQHATSFDDNKIINDISTLALREASNNNRAAYNTNSQYVDVFQDATGIDTTTNTNRSSDEYVASGSSGYGSEEILLDATGKAAGDVETNNSLPTNHVGIQNWTVSSSDYRFTSHYNQNNSVNGNKVLFGMVGESGQTVNDDTYEYFGHYTPSYGQTTNWIHLDTGNTSATGYYITKMALHPTWNGNGITVSLLGSQTEGSWTNIISLNMPGGSAQTSSSVSNTTPYRWLRCVAPYNSGVDFGWRHWRLWGHRYITNVNATGNFTGTTLTAPSSVSSMGAIITYQDQAGTNALNTDIVLQLSADGGSNYSTATLTALPDFSTGIKMAKVNDLSVTAGTNLKYKISFANQSSGVKEARIRGVSLQY